MSYVEFLSTYGDRLLDGAWITAQQFVLAVLVAIAIALTMGLAKLSHNTAVRWCAIGYIEVFRGTSLLVQLFWIFYVLPLFGLTLEKFTAGFLAVGMNLGAYGAEVVRGAIQAVPRGQYEATIALNMSPMHRMRRIILPQAFVLMLPTCGNLIIELLKGTALVALIAVADLMFQAKQINGSTFLSVEAFGSALLIYYGMARFVITPQMRRLEKYASRNLKRT